MVTKVNEQVSLWELNPIWQLLTTGEKTYVTGEAEYVRYRKNEIIHRLGDEPTHMMILVRGKVRIYIEGVGQKPQIIRMLKPGEIFGYRAIIAGDTYNTCASALEESMVLKLNKKAFLRVIQQNNRVCFGMLELLARDLGISEIKTVNLTQKHIRGRLAEAIMLLRNKYGLEEDGSTIAMHISRDDLANLSNMTTSNAIRTLGLFANEGMIRLEGKKIMLLNEEELVRISQSG
ncbi:MAG: Crp/Fnr family transcriptional regulator [Paludibacteraceae bacterium]|nr:Crp/Fnr family transcriptional regulator [Paludibacteraceae bacterium]